MALRASIITDVPVFLEPINRCPSPIVFAAEATSNTISRSNLAGNLTTPFVPLPYPAVASFPASLPSDSRNEEVAGAIWRAFAGLHGAMNVTLPSPPGSAAAAEAS